MRRNLNNTGLIWHAYIQTKLPHLQKIKQLFSIGWQCSNDSHAPSNLLQTLLLLLSYTVLCSFSILVLPFRTQTSMSCLLDVFMKNMLTYVFLTLKSSLSDLCSWRNVRHEQILEYPCRAEFNFCSLQEINETLALQLQICSIPSKRVSTDSSLK